MNELLRQLRRIRSSESGVSLIEVIVALMVFAIISIGVAYSLLSAFAMTSDSRSRAVATNLAAQEVDLDRSAADFFALQSTPAGSPKLVQVPSGTGLTYSITRTVSLVYASGSDVNCNASAASSMLYKRIHVSISWPKMIGQPVVADTVLAPSTKISVDTLGTILVSTRSANGTPVSGVSISVSPDPGSVPTATDAMGCSYVLKVPPGTYTVTASKSNYIDPKQNLSPSTTVTVTAGQSTSAGFTYDQLGTVGWSYQSLSGASLPSSISTSFLSTYGVYVTPAASSSATTAKLFPSTEYDVVAGAYAPATESNSGCRAPNPAEWPAYTNASGKTVAAPAPPSVSFTPGPTGTVPIGTLPMGSITVTNPSNATSNLYITATSAASSVSGDPGCTGKPQTITFSNVLGKSKGNQASIMLPFGTWTLKTGTTTNPTTAVASSSLSIPSGATGVTIGAGGVFTLDPRVVQP